MNNYYLLIGLTSLLLLSIPSARLSAQVIRTNEKGEKFIVYPDGTVQPFTMFSKDHEPTIKPEEIQNTGAKSYPIFDGSVASFDQRISVTEADLAKIAERRSQLSKAAEKVARARAEEAQQKRRELEVQLRSVSLSDQETKKHLTIQLEAAKKIEEETSQEAEQARKEADSALLFARGGAYLDAFIQERESSKERSRAIASGQTSRNSSAAFPIPFGQNYNGILSDQNTSLYPPAEPCKAAYEGQESNGQWRKDLQKQLLFTHTDERLRIYLKDKAYLRCEGFLTSLTGGYRYLTLQFSFAYPNAREAYGIIEKGSVLTVKLLNGQYVNLRSGELDEGSYDLETEILTYRVHYPIDRSQINILRKSEVDTVLVFWSSGFEEYEVYHLDFFMNQIECLER